MLPSAVEKQAREAEELHRQMYGNPSEKGAAENSGETEGSEQAAAEQTKPAQEQGQQPVAQEAKPAEDAAYWKARFDVVEGKYRSEVPRYAEEVRQLRARIGELEQQLSAQPPAKGPESDALVAKYGEEFVRDIRNLVPQAADESLRNKVETIEKLTVDQLRDRFYRDLSGAVPEWEALNTDPKFLDWLGGVDDLSGAPRVTMFDKAAGEFNVPRVVAFFKTYLAANQSEQKPPQQEQRQREVIAPDASRASAPAPSARKVWTHAEIDRFYTDVRRGVIPAAEASNIERDIFAAQRENRIR